MVTDAPNPNNAYANRHAYHSTDYKVSKSEMDGLYKRYAVWKSAKDKASAPEYTSFTTISADAPGRRAYQTASFDVVAVPVEQGNGSRRAYKAGHKSARLTSRVNVIMTGTQSSR
jgi:hypothetical protein